MFLRMFGRREVDRGIGRINEYELTAHVALADDGVGGGGG